MWAFQQPEQMKFKCNFAVIFQLKAVGDDWIGVLVCKNVKFDNTECSYTASSTAICLLE